MDSLNNLSDQGRPSPIDDLAETKDDEDSAVSKQLSKRALKKLKKRQE